MTKGLPQIGDKFKEAVQKTNQEQRITDLQAEVERLRALQQPELETEIAKLREQLQTQTGKPLDLSTKDKKLTLRALQEL